MGDERRRMVDVVMVTIPLENRDLMGY